MFKRLLVPLDGSKLSEAALPVVRQLIEGTEAAEVTLFSVGQRPKGTDRRRQGPSRPVPISGVTGPARGVLEAAPLVYAEDPGQAIERWEHELLEYLADLGRPLKDSGVRVTHSVHFGAPAEAIIEFARQGAFDAIVMATHGRSGLSDVIQGSVTAAVIRSGVAPVLVVRPKGRRSEGGAA
jgi:nucleotide-binding universal stress UspA family protein